MCFIDYLVSGRDRILLPTCVLDRRRRLGLHADLGVLASGTCIVFVR